MHDPRVGRFFAVDPLTVEYPHYSPYSFSGNRVIDAIELEGLEPVDPRTGKKLQISYWDDRVYSLHYKKGKDEKVYDKEMYDDVDRPILGNRVDNSHSGSWAEGASEFQPDGSIEYTSTGALNALDDILPGDNPKWKGTDPSDNMMKTAALEGTYSYLHPAIAESRFFHIDNSSYQIISAREGVLEQVVNMVWNDETDKFDIGSVVSLETITRTNTAIITYNDKTYNVTYEETVVKETTQEYKGNNSSGDPKVKNYVTNRKLKNATEIQN